MQRHLNCGVCCSFKISCKLSILPNEDVDLHLTTADIRAENNVQSDAYFVDAKGFIVYHFLSNFSLINGCMLQLRFHCEIHFVSLRVFFKFRAKASSDELRI